MKKHIVVIGSGLAGSLLSNELVRQHEVTLLEEGPKDRISYPNVEYLNKDFGAVKTFCHGGGGTTNLWHNGLIPLNPRDITSDQFVEILQEAKPYINRTASKLFFKSGKFLQEYEKLLSQMNSLVATTGFSEDGIDCLIYPKKFKRLEPEPEVKAFYEVKDIHFNLTEKKVNALSYRIKDRRYTVKPDFVVISAGTLGTPFLVIRLLEGIGFDVKKIGQGLADHPMGFIGKVRAKKEYAGIFKKLSLIDMGYYISRSAVRLKSNCGKYTCCAFFRPALSMQNKLSIYKYKSLLGASKGAERLKNALSLKILHPDILAEIFSHLCGMNLSSSVYNILVIFDQKRGNSRVYNEENGLKVDWNISEEEISVYNGILKKLKDLLLPISERLEIKIPITEKWLWSAAHHSGTIALGNSAESGIIDNNLKLHLFDNVFICDGSIIQEHSYANTGLTIGQLAMRLARHLSNQSAA